MQSCVPNKCVSRLGQMFRFALMVLTAVREICIANVTQGAADGFSPEEQMSHVLFSWNNNWNNFDYR